LNSQKIYMGLGAIAAVLLLILLFGGSGDDPEQVALADSVAQSKTEMAAMQDRITQLETELKSVTAAAGAAASSDDVVALRSDMETGISSVQSSVDAVKEDVAKVTGMSEGLMGQMTDLKTATAAATAAVAAVATQQAAAAVAAPASDDNSEPAEVAAVAPAPQETEDAAATPQTETSAPMAETLTRGVGETAVMADGALRVFVSRLDETSGNARLAINGDVKSVDVGRGPVVPVGEDYCKVVLSGITSEGAALGSLCGDAVPAPEGIKVGQTIAFEEGKLRAFVSRVDDDGARIAVNGDLQNVAIGSAAIADLSDARCRVMLDSVDRGHAALSATCGAPVEASAPAGPGSTTVFGDGATRLFVASVNEAQGTARIAINGVNVATRAKGDTFTDGEGCAIQVADVRDGKVSFKYDCDG